MVLQSARGARAWQVATAVRIRQTASMSEAASVNRSHGSARNAGALTGWTVVTTRPVGMAGLWRRHLSGAGAAVVALPGLALRAVPESEALRDSLRAASEDAAWIFTSPVAVDHARRLVQGWPQAQLIAVGRATAERLHRRGGHSVMVPAERQDSEGVLALPVLQQVAGRRLSLITGAGGRGLLQRELRRRGAQVREIEVYARIPPRLDRRHFDRVQTLPRRSILLISSAEAMSHLQRALPPALWQRLLRCPVVVSSPRLDGLARDAGFHMRCCARSALLPDMQDAAEQIALRKGRL